MARYLITLISEIRIHQPATAPASKRLIIMSPSDWTQNQVEYDSIRNIQSNPYQAECKSIVSISS